VEFASFMRVEIKKSLLVFPVTFVYAFAYYGLCVDR
jgi:hypothetical protein